MSNFSPLENENHAIHILDEDLHRHYIGEQSMFKLSKLIEGIKCKLVDVSSHDLYQEGKETKKKKWIDDGVEVEILKVGSLAWQKGKLKVKVTVEFCPDEPESMLDEYRNN